MFKHAFFLLLLLNFHLFEFTKSQTQNDLEKDFQINQFFHNCECHPFYRCSAANNYMLAARAGYIPKGRRCRNPDFICCTKTNETKTESTALPTTPPLTTTTPPLTTTTPPLTTTTTTTLTTPQSTTTPPPLTPSITTTIPTRTTESDAELPETTTPVNSLKSLHQLGCGVAKTQIGLRILNPEDDSVDTIPGEVPWIVAIFQKIKNPEISYEFQGAGTLIHPKVILTAAHCIVGAVRKPNTIKIVATGSEVFQEVDVNPDDERGVIQIIKHPNFNSGGLYNDIALLILDREYNFTNNMLNAVCLPKENQTFVGRKCIGAGWGEDIQTYSTLRKVDVPVIDSNQCQTLLRRVRSNFNLHSSFVCAGGEKGKDTCKGDGGGPLMCLGENQFVQSGIVSYGLEGRCGHEDEPGLYVDVGKFVSWVKDELLKVGIKL